MGYPDDLMDEAREAEADMCIGDCAECRWADDDGECTR
jgi:hypothetical protein